MMTQETQGTESAKSAVEKQRIVRKKRRHRRGPRWRDRLRGVLSSNVLFYLVALAVVGGVVALFIAAHGS